MTGGRMELALRLADVAAAEILPRFDRCAVERKADGSEVTDGDRAAEEAMRNLLAREAPGDAVYGEEFGGELNLEHPGQWVLDPIDGTAAFALGLPQFGTMIGLLEHGRPVLGVLSFPAAGSRLFAEHGAGCHFQVDTEAPESVQVHRVETLRQAQSSCTDLLGSDLRGEGYPLRQILGRSGRVRFVNDCWQHAWVCRGRLQLAIDGKVQPWDVVPILACIHEAGGAAMGVDGMPVDLAAPRGLVSTCGGALHQELGAILRSGSSTNVMDR